MAATKKATGRKRKLDDVVDEAPTKVAKAEEPESAADGEEKAEELDTRELVEGTVYVVGTGDCGQLGLGEDVTEKMRPGPVHLPDGEKASVVCAGGMHTVCISSSGAVYSWGVNDEGALGRYTEGEAWKKSGLAKGTPGDSYKPAKVKIPAACGRIVALSAGDSHTMALDENGAVYGWGTFRDSGGVMGFKPGQRMSVEATEVWKPRGDGEKVVKIASGTDHVVALCRNKRILTWGSGQQGQLGRVGTRVGRRGQSLVDAYLSPAAMHLPFSSKGKPVDIAAGHYCSYAIMSSGEVISCGLNNYGQLGIAAEDTDPVNLVPRKAVALQDYKIAKIFAGEHHVLALTQDDKMIAWGRPTYGRLAREDVAVGSDTGVAPAAVTVEGLEGAPSGAAAGGAVSGCFSDDMCGLWLCGFGSTGMLGKGADDDDDEKLLTKVKRTKVFNEVTVKHLEFGGQHVVMLTVPCAPPEKPADDNQ